ncbi:hypothetical protein DSM03_103113 [Leeuwenhoekiella aestuarii]|uniref:Uncharacterized protein n=1 Tax=Leeuwenhoekiella aestuarii TaxID=2249426 RepID=A0A4Q0NZ61_9FLAO|nr:hypothetical protein [Leeuwenhoekiella aestuarii]RXG15928.1 hypothetical protein DSM03_103113 [Leeuwenhoekiella aestuarii]RXG16622.1 hypothetical protein DSM04_102203 [Leeuwenhoekiella aestuarii]
MNLVYKGENPLISSAVRRTSEVLHSAFFQKHLIDIFSEEKRDQINILLDSISKSNSDILIKTYWNPFKKSSMTYDVTNQALNINIANLKKSKRFISQQLVENYSLLELSKINGDQENGEANKALASKMSSLAKYYA